MRLFLSLSVKSKSSIEVEIYSLYLDLICMFAFFYIIHLASAGPGVS